MGCVVCEKIAQRKAVIVYEDESLVAILPSRPAVLGHIKIYPRNHISKLDELDETIAELYFGLANTCSSIVFDLTKAQGTNIILNESEEHLVLDVVPRRENDGLNFVWKSKQSTQEELDEIASKISDKTFTMGKKEAPQKIIEEKSKPVEEVRSHEDQNESDDTSKDGNYLIRNLTRIP